MPALSLWFDARRSPCEVAVSLVEIGQLASALDESADPVNQRLAAYTWLRSIAPRFPYRFSYTWLGRPHVQFERLPPAAQDAMVAGLREEAHARLAETSDRSRIDG
jgi:hypothetical protein